MKKHTTNKDFDTSHLTGEALRVAKVVLDLLPADASGGGCGAFASPEEWAARGEKYGLDSLLILVHDGGDLAPRCNWDYCNYKLQEEFLEGLKLRGFYYDQCTSWYSAVYPM